MQHSQRTISLVAICLAALLFQGCATKIVSVVYTSQPPLQIAVRPDYEIYFKPAGEGQTFFSMFELDVVNKSGGIIEVDWNRTFYLHNGKAAGRFVFAGINPEDVKNAAVPNDAIAQAGRLTRQIAPHQLIAKAPDKDLSVKPGESGISGGVLPEGENGIQLTLLVNGRPVEEQLAVTVRANAN